MEKISLTADFSLSGLIEKYIRQLFEDKQVSEENRERLWSHYYEKLSAGVDEGYSPAFEFYDEDLAKSLKQSIAAFSAFKETSFRKTLEDLLTKDGKLTPWNDFKKEAFKVSGDYNHRWLETEYHQTVANANMAQTWQEFGQNTDLYPNVKLVSVHDARVRPEHKILDGTIRPYNDPFWKTHLPPLDWGCRCGIEQTDEEPTEIKGGVQMKIEFENNPAHSGEIFGDTAYKNSLSKAEIKDAQKFAKSQTTEGKVTFDDDFDEKDFERNLEVAEICSAQTEHRFHIRQHIQQENVSNPEYLIDDKFLADRKSITNTGKGMLNGFDGSKTQMLNKGVNPDQNNYCIVWDLDYIDEVDWNEVTRNLQRKVTPERGKKIEGMFFQYKGRAIYISRDEILSRDFSKFKVFNGKSR